MQIHCSTMVTCSCWAKKSAFRARLEKIFLLNNEKGAIDDARRRECSLLLHTHPLKERSFFIILNSACDPMCRSDLLDSSLDFHLQIPLSVFIFQQWKPLLHIMEADFLAMMEERQSYEVECRLSLKSSFFFKKTISIFFVLLPASRQNTRYSRVR